MGSVQTYIEAIVEWLKDLTAIQTIAAIIAAILAAVAAYYTYKSYKDNKPVKLTILYSPDGTKKKVLKNTKNIEYYDNFIAYYYDPNCLIDQRCKMGDLYVAPKLINNMRKSIKDFHLSVTLYGNWIDKVDKNNIHPDYEIIEFENNHRIHLRYKHNVLGPLSIVPELFNTNYIVSKNPKPESTERFRLFYSITYEGIHKRLEFWVNNTVCYIYSNELGREFIRKHFDSFLTTCYNNGSFKYDFKRIKVDLFHKKYTNGIFCDEPKIVLLHSERVRNRSNTIVSFHDILGYIVTPPLILTDKKFDKFKKKLIENLPIIIHVREA